MQTSLDHPLKIDAVTLAESGGRIGMTLCPGKKQRGAMSGDWDRDLQLDLQAIAVWGASIIINLIEDHEMVALAVEHTRDLVPKGIDYYRMPIPDFGTPDAGWESKWAINGPIIRRQLQAGEAVLVHCKGGLGRAGMISARILVELGVAPDEAIAAVRNARSGAIETAQQERYVRAIEPV